MSHQDWTPVILKKTIVKPTVAVNAEPKKSIAPVQEALDMDEKKVEFFTPAMGKRIATLRNEKGWTQEQLAQRLNLPKKTINDVEAGKEKYSGPLVAKFKRVLGNFSW